MKMRDRSEMLRDQRSVFYMMPDAGRLRRSYSELYTHMFVEDIAQSLLPYSLTRDGEFRVAIIPENDQMEAIVSAGLDISRQGYRSRDLVRALREFLRLTMTELCFGEQVTCEIAYLRETQKDGPSGFELVHINRRQIRGRFGRIFQVVPPEIARERRVEERIPLPAENLALFKLPRELARPIRGALDALSVLSDSSWHRLVMDSRAKGIPYDYAEHARSMRLALAEAGMAVGWTGRGSLNESMSGYYLLHQQIKFRIFATRARTILLAQINDVLQRIGRKLGSDVQIALTGGPTIADLERDLKDLAAGSKPFLDVLNSIHAEA